MKRLEVSGSVRPLWWSLGVKGLNAPFDKIKNGGTYPHIMNIAYLQVADDLPAGNNTTVGNG